MMELLFHAQIGGIFEMFVDQVDLARLALSCHFALDVLCIELSLTEFRRLTRNLRSRDADSRGPEF